MISRLSLAAAACLFLSASAAAFQIPAAAATLRTSSGVSAAAPKSLVPAVPRQRAALALRMAALKDSPLDHAGSRAVEEEERISMWKVKFELDNEQVETLRKSFETVLDT